MDTVSFLFSSLLHFTWFYFWSLSSGIIELEKNSWSNNKKGGEGGFGEAMRNKLPEKFQHNATAQNRFNILHFPQNIHYQQQLKF